MTEDEYTQSLSRLSDDEVRRVLALDLAVKSLTRGHTEVTVVRRAEQLVKYIKTGVI